MGVLIITEADRAHIQQMIAQARALTRPWAEIKHLIQDDRGKPTNTLTLAERTASKEAIRQLDEKYPVQSFELGTYTIALSFEEQPDGVFRHMSVAAERPGVVPNQHVIAMLAPEFGFSGWPLTRPSRIWLEEFEPGHHAVNLMELIE